MTALKGATHPLSRLTPGGVDAFRALIVEARDGLAVNEVLSRATDIASSPRLSVAMPGEVTLDSGITFSTRGDVGRYTGNLLKQAGLPAGPATGQENLWSWMALVLLAQICRHRKNGTLKVGEPARYILSHDYKNFYRHLVAGPAWVHDMHGVKARLFLCQKPYIMPEIMEQVASRFDMITSAAVIDLIDAMYYDEASGQPKKGFSKRDGSRVPAAGTLRALDAVLSQLGCTYDIRSMTPQQIISKLPAEFGAWME